MLATTDLSFTLQKRLPTDDPAVRHIKDGHSTQKLTE